MYGRDPTSHEVKALWRHFQVMYHSHVMPKAQAWQMRFAARFLNATRILDRERFMTCYTTVVGRRIFVPFEVGVVTGRRSLWSQIVTVTHEHQHIVQLNRDGAPRFMAAYLLSPRARARYEADAYACHLALHYWRFHELLPTRPIVERLRDYACRGADLDVAQHHLDRVVQQLSQRTWPNQATRDAIVWLEAHAPDVRMPIS